MHFRILSATACPLRSVGPLDLDPYSHPDLQSVTLSQYQVDGGPDNRAFSCDGCTTVNALWDLNQTGALNRVEELLFRCDAGEKIDLSLAKEEFCSGGIGMAVAMVCVLSGGVIVACIVISIVSR